MVPEMDRDWFSYDSIAGHYATAAEPLYFEEPARDLVSVLRLEAGERLLDIGSGSGAIAAAAMRANPRSVVVACDRSLSMLQMARERNAVARAVAGELPRLPFRAETFDAASLGFVLSHVGDVGAALREVARILLSGGRVAASSWVLSASETGPGALWNAVGRQYVDGAALDDAVARALPSEERLARSSELADALHEAGFVRIRTEARAYTKRVSTSAFLQSRLISATARYLRANLDDRAFERFVVRVTEEITRECGSELVLETSVSFVTARTR
jgi:ubiquinone/menaquinone biosynthesis C-methylase UbiE